jgi:electron transfer flavoprotein beta subunit
VDQIIDFSKETRTITVRRKLEGRKEVVQTQLPALLTMVREGNNPRYPTVPSRLGAEETEVTVWNNDILKLAPELIGLRGSPTNVKRIFAPERKMGEILGDGEKDPQGAVQLLVQKLVERDLLSF